MGKEAYLPEAAWRSPLYISGSSHYFKRTGDIPDRIAGVSFSNNAMFDINVVDHGNPFETYYDFPQQARQVIPYAAGRSECLIRYSLQCNSADTISEARTSGQVPFLQLDVSE